MNWVSFLIGLFIGSIFGVILMCIFQINRNEEE